MMRLRKAFVLLLAAYIITVIIMVSKLRESNQRHPQSMDIGNVDLADNVLKHSLDDDTSVDDFGVSPRKADAIDARQDHDDSIKTLNVNKDVETSDVGRFIRYGPGENGTAVKILNKGKLFKAPSESHQSSILHGFNTYISDIVSLHRKVPDFRPEACKAIKYPIDMGPASVVIIFRDELPSIVLRTAYSVLDASPANLLKEIILVDDGSTDVDLKTKIDAHVVNVDKFKLVTNPTPLGLMLARQKGIEATTSEYFVVMDGHMEVGPGWLEPLIARLHEVPKALLCSHVYKIDKVTFQLRVPEPIDDHFPFFDTLTMTQALGAYSHEFQRERNGSVAPKPMGTIQGMIAAMRKDFFLQLGGFDPGMRQWGSEQMELSIKVWMCGGRVELVPCSKVAHMFRITPWAAANVTSDFIVANSLRTTEVWFDDPYKSIIRESIGTHSQYDIGDLTDRHRIRKENNCKPFQYFVDIVKTFSNVYFFGKVNATGRLRNRQLDTCLKFNLGISTCLNSSNYHFILTEHGQLRSIMGTIVLTKHDKKHNTTAAVERVISHNYLYMRNALWEYRNDGSLYNVASNYCLTVDIRNKPVAEKCTGELIQQWDWQGVNKGLDMHA